MRKEKLFKPRLPMEWVKTLRSKSIIYDKREIKKGAIAKREMREAVSLR